MDTPVTDNLKNTYVQDETAPKNTACELEITNMKIELVFKVDVCFNNAQQNELLAGKVIMFTSCAKHKPEM